MNTGLRLIRVGIAGALAAALWLPGAGVVRAQSPVVLDPSKAVTQYVVDTWTSDNGLPQNTINVIAQTRKGYLWLGTQEGLVRFDGHTFRTIKKQKSGLRNNVVTSLLEDRSGRLWIGTRGGGLAVLDEGELEPRAAMGEGCGDQVSALAEDASGRLWVGTYDRGLCRVDGASVVRLGAGEGISSQKISFLSVDESGRLWVGTRDAGVFVWNGRRFQPGVPVDRLPGADVTAVLVDRSGAVWIGTRKSGLVRSRAGRVETFTTADGLPSDAILSLVEDGAGSLWIGTEQGGLTRYSAGAFATLDADDGLTTDNVQTLFEDREGSLWLGTKGGGLNRIRDGKFLTFTRREGLGSDIVYTVHGDREGAVWAGTDGGGLTRLKDGQARTFTTADGLPSDQILSVTGSRDGSLWIGTYGGGLSRYSRGRFSTFTVSDGLPSDRIFALFEDAKGTLWIATDQGVSSYRDGRFSTLTVREGLSSNSVTAVAEGRDGSILVGTYDGGLNVVRGGKVVRRVTTKDGLGSNFILSIYTDARGVVWFSMREGGLARWDGSRLALYTTVQGLFNDSISQILEDAHGNLWMSSNAGLFYAAVKDLDAYAEGRRSAVPVTVLDRSDGLKSEEFNGGTQPAGFRGQDGRLWFPTSRGVVAVDPANLRRNELPPLVTVERVRFEGEDRPALGEVVIPPGHAHFEFHYAGLSLVAPDRVRYRYMLEGFDEGWIEAGSRREAYYTNLRPGTYRFRVIAQNADGVWSQEAGTAIIRLEPFFYQTWLFWALLALAAAGLAFFLYRLRIRSLTYRQKELERLVAERTYDLQQAKEQTETALQETERERDRVEEGRRVIEAQADQLREMDRIKTRFFNNISHEFRTPLTLTIGPLENALTGAYGEINEAVRSQLDVMLRNTRRLLRLINQLLDLAKLESGKMTPRLVRGNLAELAEGVVLSFSAFAAQSGIDLHYEQEEAELGADFDAECMEKVLFNLLSNAVKFTPSGGEIAVSARSAVLSQDGVEVPAVELRVRDSGTGIPAHELPHIYDRFHQVDGTTTRVQEGTGIGLSLVKELVELHHGTITVESEVGHGTEFTIRLPRSARNAEHLAASGDGAADRTSIVTLGPLMEMAVLGDEDARAPEGPEQGRNEDHNLPLLLVIDDNADIRSYVTSIVRAKYRVVTARDGQEGLEVMRRTRPDLVLSDVMMPNMSGYEFCKHVKQDAELSHTPVILLTARGSLDDKIEGFGAGADEYLAKPFNARELLARIENLLALRAHRRELVSLNDQLREANTALLETAELKSQLLRIAAHDMKNPLNGIRELAKVIAEELGGEHLATEFASLIRASSDQLLHMVAQLLDSEALENAQQFDREPLDVRSIVQEVVGMNFLHASQKEQQLHVEVEHGDSFWVEGDRQWLLSAVDNLVSNAIKYSPLGEEVAVRVHAEGGSVSIEVEDRGPGFTPEDEKRLFGKFQRLSAQPTGGESSTGLGLSIVKQVVERHRGRISLTTVPAKGSIFRIELPSVELSAVSYQLSGKPALPVAEG